MDGEGGGEVSAVLKRFIEKFSVGVKTFTCNYLHLATVAYKSLGECQLFGDFVDIWRGDVKTFITRFLPLQNQVAQDNQ